MIGFGNRRKGAHHQDGGKYQQQGDGTEGDGAGAVEPMSWAQAARPASSNSAVQFETAAIRLIPIKRRFWGERDRVEGKRGFRSN